MFKGRTVGNDTEAYIRLFGYAKNFSISTLIKMEGRYEIGFLLFIKVFSYYFDYQVLFAIVGLFVSFSFGRYIYKYSKRPAFSILAFYTLQFFDLSMSGLRQIIAISILLYAFDFLLRRKPLYFIVIVVIASLFHTSSLLFLIAYPLCNKERKNMFYLISLFAFIFVFALFDNIVIPIVSRFLPQYLKYFSETGNSYSNSLTLASLLMTIVFGTLFMFTKYVENTNKEVIRSLNLERYRLNYINDIVLWLGFLMLILSWNGTILTRYKYVFSFAVLISLPNSIYMIRNKKEKIFFSVLISSCLIAYILVIYIFRPEWQSTFPYTPFWKEGGIL